MKQYVDLLKKILADGEQKSDRTGFGTISLFGHQMRFDLSQGLPVITTKRIPFRWVVEELLWMISGETNIRPLLLKNIPIWTDWPLQRFNKSAAAREEVTLDQKAFEREICHNPQFADQWGDIGPGYGHQWRRWRIPESQGGGYIDQIEALIQGLREDPYSRRHLVSAWNVADVEDMLLPPCHLLFQFYVSPGVYKDDKAGCYPKSCMTPGCCYTKPKLSCQLYQRSADAFLGLPFNIASYALLTVMIAQVVGMTPGEFVHTSGDVHLYLNQIAYAKQQVEREPRPPPQVKLDPSITNLFEFRMEHIELVNYNPHPPFLRVAVAV
jgi:thymidylate synthase